MGHHTVIAWQISQNMDAVSALAQNAYAGAATAGNFIGTAQELAGPKRFGLDFRILVEQGTARRLRQAEIDRVPVILVGKSQFQGDPVSANHTLDRHVAGFHGPRESFGPGPERRLQSPLQSQCGDRPTLGNIGKEPDGLVEAGLAGAVGAGDNRQAFQRDHQVAQGSVAGNGKSKNHWR